MNQLTVNDKTRGFITILLSDIHGLSRVVEQGKEECHAYWVKTCDIHPVTPKRTKNQLAWLSAKDRAAEIDTDIPEAVAEFKSRCVLGIEVTYENQDVFFDEFEANTGVRLHGKSIPGVYSHHEGANKWANAAHIQYTGELPEELRRETSAEPKRSGDGWVLYDTAFVYTLILAYGFTLDFIS